MLSTKTGDVRFHAPHLYQADRNQANQGGSGAEKVVSGSFRQLADNQIGFAVGPYDHSRELVIDPQLSFSTYLGGSGTESLVQVAVDSSSVIYVAGSTDSADFPTTTGALQGLTGTQNIFIARIAPLAPAGSQLLYSTYLGGEGMDSLSGIAVDPSNGLPNIYVAGYTTSGLFPTTSANAFQTAPETVGTHGFLSKLSPATGGVYTLTYSSYLSGSGTDTLTGLAVDSIQNAYMTGTTTSIDVGTGFPSTPNGFQLCPFEPIQPGGNPCPLTTGPPQFFASKINTLGTGTQSMLYSTYFGGGNPSNATATGGGAAVDASGDMYFTGTTNMQGVAGPNPGEFAFPLVNAYQDCLNNELVGGVCSPSSATDAILVKLNPSLNSPQAPPLVSTYLGGNMNDTGIAVGVDSSSNAYVTGSTNSLTTGATDWNCVSPCILGPFATYSGGGDAFIAKIGNQTQAGALFPLNYFTYIGGTGSDSGQSIVVDSVQSAHVAGSTTSTDLPTLNALTAGGGQNQGTGGDAFVALIATASTVNTGDYLTYLGGSALDQGTGIALDINNSAYVVGNTVSANFPVSANAIQTHLDGSEPDAFVTQLGASSTIALTALTPAPMPVPAGSPAIFTFDLTNNGPDPATNVTFFATVPTVGLASVPFATPTSGGTCAPALGSSIVCQLGTLAVNGVSSVNVNVTPVIPENPANPFISVSGAASSNGGPTGQPVGQQDPITDFTMSGSPSTLNVKAGDLASFTITLTPGPLGYNTTVSMSQTSQPSIITNPAPTFTNPTVALVGTSAGTTTLNIQTVPRPINTGSLLRRGSFYAAWLPIGGMSLLGLGVGASRKRRRWIIGGLLGLLAGLILLQPACSGASTPVAAQGGTAAGQYTITIEGSTAGISSHSCLVTLNVS